jgi:SET domain-containing protein
MSKCKYWYSDWAYERSEEWPRTLNIQKSGATGFGAFARRKIEAGEVLAEYTGQLLPLDTNNTSEYQTGIAMESGVRC